MGKPSKDDHEHAAKLAQLVGHAIAERWQQILNGAAARRSRGGRSDGRALSPQAPAPDPANGGGDEPAQPGKEAGGGE